MSEFSTATKVNEAFKQFQPLTALNIGLVPWRGVVKRGASTELESEIGVKQSGQSGREALRAGRVTVLPQEQSRV